ncbi:MAG: stage V sporulation T C-terminal domain-containing protein [Christensenellales bacterium]
MKTTGIVRRIDELGRVVIPKEIRKTMRIKEGEEMEVCVSDGDTLVLKKYSPIKTLEKLGREYAEILHKHTDYACYICDNDEITASCGDRETPVGAKITKSLETVLRQRKSGYLRKAEAFAVTVGGEKNDVAYAPIIAGGDVVGGFILAAKGGAMSGADKCVKLLEVGANFFAMQLE